MTPLQYIQVDPSEHTFADLVEEITTCFVLDGFVVTSIKQSDVHTWMVNCADGDTDQAYSIAHDAVRRLRSPSRHDAAMDLYEGFENRRPPSYSILGS